MRREIDMLPLSNDHLVISITFESPLSFITLLFNVEAVDISVEDLLIRAKMSISCVLVTEDIDAGNGS